MGLLDSFLEKRLERVADKVTTDVATRVTKHVEGEILKASAPTPTYMTGLTGASPGAKRYQFSQDMINGGVQRRKKPGSDISFETLRRFSVQHEVSRACINYRKRQITGMEWKIVTADDDRTAINDGRQKVIEDFFDNLGGRGIGYRRFMDKFVEDLLAIDAVALEKQFTRGSSLHTLVPIDGATIRLRVDEAGATPEPPEAAYVQVIRGQVTAEWTDDEMIYAIMNSRNDTPYGLAPLESLMIIVTSSLKAGMYNLAYLTDGNIPEGFYTMPENWTPQNIKDFQEYFDAMMAGDEQKTRQLKFMPKGEYMPTTKPSDMAFQEFNDWLMKITCALFEVDPKEIGFSPKSGLGGKGYAEQAAQTTDNKGLLPLALFIEETFTKVIQEDLGFPDLKFDFPTLRQKDAKGQAETNEILIRSGQRTVNELRTDEGLDPIPGLDKPFTLGQVTFLDEESQNDARNAAAAVSSKLPNGAAEEEAGQAGNGQPIDGGKTKAESAESLGKSDARGSYERVMSLRSDQINELRTFRKYAVNRKKSDKAIRPFISAVLPAGMVEELNSEVTKSTDVGGIRKAFDERIKELELLNVDTALEARNAVANII